MLLGFFIPHVKYDVVSYPRCQPEVAVHLEEIIINSTASIPVWEKLTLTLTEAAEYSGIGVNKIRDISNDPSCPFVLWNGSKRLIKRRPFDTYIKQAYSI